MEKSNNNGWIPLNRLAPIEGGFFLVWVESSFPKNSHMLVAEYIAEDVVFISEHNDSVIEDVIYWRRIEAPNQNIIYR